MSWWPGSSGWGAGGGHVMDAGGVFGIRRIKSEWEMMGGCFRQLIHALQMLRKTDGLMWLCLFSWIPSSRMRRFQKGGVSRHPTRLLARRSSLPKCLHSGISF